MFTLLLRALLIFPIFLLTACASSAIDETIPLSESFEQNSEFITFNKTAWKVGGKAFNQKLRNYSVENADVRWKKSKQRFSESEREKSGFINYVFFDDDYAIIKEKFDVDKSQQYSFDLKQNEDFIANSKCEIFSHSLNEKILSQSDSGGEYREDGEVSSRLETYVFCVIEHKGGQWKLSLFDGKDEPLDVQLESEDKFYEILGVSEQLLLKQGNKGIEKVKMPKWLAQNSGLEFYKEQNKIAALSFVGKPKMWLQEDLSDDEKELLLTVNYSLSMFNWLDEEWKDSSN